MAVIIQLKNCKDFKFGTKKIFEIPVVLEDGRRKNKTKQNKTK